MNGRIKTATSKGFGFIETDLQIDFFFHYTALVDYDWKNLLKDIVSGYQMSVTFDNDETAPSGPRAINVRIIKTEKSIQPEGT